MNHRYLADDKLLAETLHYAIEYGETRLWQQAFAASDKSKWSMSVVHGKVYLWYADFLICRCGLSLANDRAIRVIETLRLTSV